MASNYNRKSASSGSRSGRSSRRPQNAGSSRRPAGMPRSGASAPSGRGSFGQGGSAPRASRHAQNPRPSRGSAPRGGRPASRSGARRPNPSGRRVSSVRLGELQSERGQRMQAGYRRYVNRILIALGVFAACVAIYGVLYFSPLFGVNNVTVKGCEHLTAEEVSNLAAVPQPSTLLRVDSAGICSRLETNPWVEKAQVTPILPDTLELDITERTIDAVVEVTTEKGDKQETWAIASDGMWLMKIPAQDSTEASQISSKVYEDAEKVLHITGVPYGVAPEAGAYCTDASVKNAVDIVSGMTTELADQVKSVEATSSDNATLTLDSGLEIAFGSDDDIRDKERVCLQLMEEHEGLIAYINVRTPANPTWRSL